MALGRFRRRRRRPHRRGRRLAPNAIASPSSKPNSRDARAPAPTPAAPMRSALTEALEPTAHRRAATARRLAQRASATSPPPRPSARRRSAHRRPRAPARPRSRKPRAALDAGRSRGRHRRSRKRARCSPNAPTRAEAAFLAASRQSILARAAPARRATPASSSQNGFETAARMRACAPQPDRRRHRRLASAPPRWRRARRLATPRSGASASVSCADRRPLHASPERLRRAPPRARSQIGEAAEGAHRARRPMRWPQATAALSRRRHGAAPRRHDALRGFRRRNSARGRGAHQGPGSRSATRSSGRSHETLGIERAETADARRHQARAPAAAGNQIEIAGRARSRPSASGSAASTCGAEEELGRGPRTSTTSWSPTATT